MAGWLASAQDQPTDSAAPRRPRLGRPPQEILDKYDINKDGKLDEQERATLHQDVADGKVQPPPLARGPRGPQEDGQPQPPAGDRPGPGPAPSAKELIAKYDADKDGKLDETELAAMLKDIPRRPPPMAAGRGPGRFGPRPPLDGEGPQGVPQQ